MSSTALVLSFLQKNGDISLPYGRISVTILIYQDIASVLMVILFPLLGQNTGGLSTSQMLLNLGKNLLPPKNLKPNHFFVCNNIYKINIEKLYCQRIYYNI